MNKKINGKTYNTETAKLIASRDNGLGRHEIEYVEEELYKKETGEYFLYGHGGAMSRYAQPAECDNWTGGAEIIPFTVDEAKKWMKGNASADDYIAEFGGVEE